ncbi:MAG: hypothetical protein ABJA10_10835 [Aestuariivirga sp.]
MPLGQQARYIAYTWAGIIPTSDQNLRAALEDCRITSHHDDYRAQNEMALRLSRLCGTDPVNFGTEAFQKMLNESATTAIVFRLVGPYALPDASTRFMQARASQISLSNLHQMIW